MSKIKKLVTEQEQQRWDNPESVSDDDYNDDYIDNEFEDEIMPHQAIHVAIQSS